MPRRPELEAALEDRCVARIEALGGMALKLRPPTGRGFPDRTCMTAGHPNLGIPSHVFFLEFKRSKVGVVSTQQATWRRMLTLLGFGVYFIDSDEAFETALERELGR